MAADLRRWMWLILVAAMVAAGMGGAYQVQSPRQFEADTALLYRFGREYFPVAPGEQPRNWSENVRITLDSAIFTEMRILSSHQVFERTLERLGDVELLPASQPAGDEAPTSARVRDLVEAVHISRFQGASIVHVSAKHPDSDVADRIVSTHIDTYLEWRDELLDRDATAYFENQLNAAREEHQTLIAVRKQIEDEYGIFDATIESDIAWQDLSEAESQLLQNPGNVQLTEAVRSARDRVKRVDLFRTITEPLDRRIALAVERQLTLEVEETNWTLTRDFSKKVAPVVSVIDQRTATENPVGMSPGVAAAIAGLLGAILAGLGVLILEQIRRMSLGDAPPEDSIDERPASELFRMAAPIK
ncbi:MAG: hypothetical protein QNJ20_04380 [Paracoccaceae bacterium]|nr:hypothetical protein [Paracoccaceae bacterium]